MLLKSWTREDLYLHVLQKEDCIHRHNKQPHNVLPRANLKNRFRCITLYQERRITLGMS
jgi:hypothetical protein